MHRKQQKIGSGALILLILLQFGYAQNRDYIVARDHIGRDYLAKEGHAKDRTKRDSVVRDYIVRDSVPILGVTLVKGSAIENAQFLRVKVKDGEVSNTPDQLVEYGFSNGQVYVSRTISVSGEMKRVFLERLAVGQLNLYFYVEERFRTFFVEKSDSILVELSRSDYRQKLTEITSDFDWAAGQPKLTRYTKESLRKFITQYNHQDNSPLPFPKLGVVAGYSIRSLRTSSNTSRAFLQDLVFPRTSLLSVGVIADLPIGMTHTSLVTGVFYSQTILVHSYRFLQTDIDAIIALTSLNAPVMVRYTLPSLKWRPFFNGGLIFNYDIRNHTNFYQTTREFSVISIDNIWDEPLNSRLTSGYTLGLGISRVLGYGKTISAELRFHQLSIPQGLTRQTQLDFLIGISI